MSTSGKGTPNTASDLSDKKKPKKKPGLIPTHGGYRNLKSFQVAELVYDGTAIFCDRFIDRRSRTHDQMVQAARSGRQNIAEGSMASATSKKMELKLTGVANTLLCLINQTTYLLKRQIEKLEQDFLDEGGFTERLYHARQRARRKDH